MAHKYINKLLILLCLALSPTLAFAAEKLTFKDTISQASAYMIDRFLKENNHPPHTSYLFARTDLNRDGFEEYILRPKNCQNEHTPCTYEILAETQGKIISLGQINARKLLLGDSFSRGIQDFLAFRSDTNDYEYERYMWSPLKAVYVPLDPE